MPHLQFIVAVFLSFILQATAHAGAFQIMPVRLTLTPQQGTTILTIRNDSKEASVMQLELVSWSQDKGEDRYMPTRDILATPPIFTIPAGGKQIVRVGLRRKPELQSELAYRIFITEVPAATRAAGEVKIALRFGIPVFVAPSAKAANAALQWRAMAIEPGHLHIEATNRGNMHIQIAAFTLTAADGTVVAKQEGMSYLLAKQSRQWQLAALKLPALASKLQLLARTDANDIKAEVLVEP
jgi:fimbrial chaperone protein